MRQQIDELDERYRIDEEQEGSGSSSTFDHVVIGSPQPKIAFRDLEEQKKSDIAFTRFRIRLADFFNNFLPSHGIKLPGGKLVKFSKDDMVSILHSAIFDLAAC
jgi:hypothetical protein